MPKEVYTTGEVAEICNVDLKTVIKWFDAGRLEGYKVPGSNYRRIPYENLVHFMNENGIPTRNLEQRKKKVLIVDDELDIVEYIEGTLSGDKRMEVYSATNGCYACFQIGVLRPDLICLDVKMPMMDGVEVCNWIRGNATTKETKILMITGFPDAIETDKMLKSGVDGLLKKPVHMNDLKGKVLELLGLEDKRSKTLV